MEQRLDRVLGRRLARPHHPIDRNLRRVLIGRIVTAQRLRNVRAHVEIVRVDRLDLGDARRDELFEQVVGDFVVGLCQQLAGGLIDDVQRERTPDDVVARNGDSLHVAVGQLAHVPRGDPLVLRHDDLAVLAVNIEARHFAAQALRHELEIEPLRRQMERVEHEELLEHVLVRQPDRLQQRCHRHLAAAVDAEEQEVLRIELEIEPRPAVRNHARREQQLAG